jgi:hypothetical protein
MSVFATAWAWDQPVKQNEKLLLLFLADNADRSGGGNALTDVLDHAQEVCGFDRQTLRKHLEYLGQSGLFQTTASDGYRLNLGESKPKLGAFRLDVD